MFEDMVLKAFNMQHVDVVRQPRNAFEGKVPRKGYLPDRPLYYSELGTPVMSDLTLGDRVNLSNNAWVDGAGREQRFEPVTLATVLVTVMQSKSIITTQVQGRNGTVKEYIGLGDFDVTINGIIVGRNGVYPREQVRRLKQLLDAPVPVVVSSWYLQNLDIDTVVIKDYEIGQQEGEYSMQRFTINALSDTPFELKLSNV